MKRQFPLCAQALYGWEGGKGDVNFLAILILQYCQNWFRSCFSKLLCSIIIILFISTQALASEFTIASPDGRLRIKVAIDGGSPYYEVYSDTQIVVRKSYFSFGFKDQTPLGLGLVVTDCQYNSIDTSWETICGTDKVVRNSYGEHIITFTEPVKHGRTLKVFTRAYNDGVAFRYELSNWKNKDMEIVSENTQFNFPANDSAWWIPADEFAYESLYRHTPLSQIEDCNTPITIETSTGLYLSIHEAALSNYSEMTLKRQRNKSLSLVSKLWPGPDSICATVPSPFTTPWRTIQISRTPGGLIESHLIQNLNEPCALKDVSWIKPLKFVGIWWGMHTGKYTWSEGPKHGATTARTKQYIDFAAAHNFGGVLAEGWNKGWETWASGKIPSQDFSTPYPDFDLEEICTYAIKKKVNFISHHETGGNIPEYERQMEDAFALCQKQGIHYLKTGYAGTIIPKGYHHHGQYMVNHFQKVVETAAKYLICLDVHESSKPTGLDRTWPNLLSQEAARGNEWNATYNATPPYHEAILPFTRFLAGPYDYTPGIFRINHTPEQSKRLYCTIANQLALSVVQFSPIMMASDMIENYENNPAFKFLEDVPSSWDETKVIDAHIGHYIAIARRKADKWFIGAICDEHCYLIKQPLSFLDKNTTYLASIYSDSTSTDWEINPESNEIGKYLVTNLDTIYSTLAKAGGQAIELSLATPSDIQKYPRIRMYNMQASQKMKVFFKQKTFGDNHISHLGLNKPLILATKYSSQYPGSGKNSLVDGIRGTCNFSNGAWQGYQGVDLSATIDLKQITEIDSIKTGFLYSPNDWIFFPSKVEFLISSDGVNFSAIGSDSTKNEQPANMNIRHIKDFKALPGHIKARYVKVIATNIKICPSWHTGAGQKAWMFCDEIMVQ